MSWRHALELLIELTRKEIRVRYKSSYLGYLWSILNPMALAAVFYFAFRIIMKVQIKDYAFFLVVGLFPWQWFANSLGAGCLIYISNATLVKKTPFPRSLLPLATVCNDMVHFVVAIPVALFVGLEQGHTFSWVLLWGLPFAILAQLAVTYGSTLVVAALNPFFRDMERLIQVFLMMLFYATPIVYTIDMVPPHLRFLIYLNPMATVIDAYGELFLHGVFPAKSLAISFAWGGVLLLIGYAVHARARWSLAEVL